MPILWAMFPLPPKKVWSDREPREKKASKLGSCRSTELEEDLFPAADTRSAMEGEKA